MQTNCLPRLHLAQLFGVLCCLLLAQGRLVPPVSAAPDAAGPATVRGDYRTPRFAVPYAYRKPDIDGIVNADEWRGALSVNALQTTQGEISARQTRFLVEWDEDDIYVAMQSPLRDGERLIQAVREQNRNVNVVMDDSWEIWLDAGTRSPDGQPVFFQFLSNFAGAKWNAMQEPAAGNYRLTWPPQWQVRCRLAPGNVWEAEAAIPRSSLFVDRPFRDGDVLHGLLARNFKRPWEQNSVEGTGSFSARDAYSQWTLSKSAPAIRLDGVSSSDRHGLGVNLSMTGGQRTAHVTWSYSSDSGASRAGVLEAAGGQSATTGPLFDIDTLGTGAFRVRAVDNDTSQVLLDWSSRRSIAGIEAAEQKMNDTGDVVSLSLTVNPLRDYVRVAGDFIDFDARGNIKRLQLSVRDTTGKIVATEPLALDSQAYANGVLHLKDFVPGEYDARLEAFDSAGRILAAKDGKLEKRDAKSFAWWNTSYGNIERVIAPWTPVKYENEKFDVWGRAMRVGSAGLPSQIVSQNVPILARPMELVGRLSDGQVLKSSPTRFHVLSQRPNRVVLNADSTLGPLKVSSTVTVEFDGMYRVDMAVSAPPQGVALASLQLVAALRPENATYVFGKGEGIRSGFNMTFLPSGRGRVWDSTRVDSQPLLVGSFVPYIYLGGSKAGLCWYADSDEGWVPNESTPAIEVRRDMPGSIDLVFNFVSSDIKLVGARRMSFAFQATPVKPLPDKWRMDTWWTDNTFRDYAGVEKHGGNLIFTSIPFPLDPAVSRAMVDKQHDADNSFIFGFKGSYRSNAVPYFEHVRMGESFAPDVALWSDEWKTRVSEGMYYGKTLQDFMIYNLAEWIKSAGIDGFYLDNVYPLADDNIDAGRGYRLPDGRIQPTYATFETRQYLLRMRAVFQEQEGKSKVVLHITNNMIVPWVEAADVVLDGEDNVIYPEANKDFMDYWHLERLWIDQPALWGVPVNFLQEFQGNWDQTRLAKAMRSYSGMMLLDDTLASANANGMNPPLWIARDRFGIENGDVQFVPYWSEGSGVHVENAPDVLVSFWKRPGKVLLAIVNRGEATTARVRLDSAKLALGGPSGWTVSDAEAGTIVNKGYVSADPQALPGAWNSASQKKIRLDGNALLVPVERHDYRQVIIEATAAKRKN